MHGQHGKEKRQTMDVIRMDPLSRAFDDHVHRPIGSQKRKPFYQKKKTSPVNSWTRFKNVFIEKFEVIFKASKCVVFLACCAAFLYYVAIFFQMYQEFNTVVEVNIEFPMTPELPAITVCNNNVLMRSVFCTEYKSYCGTDGKLKKGLDIRDILAIMNVSTIKRLGHRWEDQIVSCKTESKRGDQNISVCNTEFEYLLYDNQNCYVINPHWDPKVVYDPHISSNDTATKMNLIRQSLSLTPAFKFLLNINKDEYLSSNVLHGAEVYIHSPYSLPDSRSGHFPAKSAKTYNIGISKITAELMEKPYKTMCMNYSRNLEKHKKFNDIELPTNQRLCTENCLTESAMIECGCTPNCVSMTENSTKCNTSRNEHRECCTKIIDDSDRCSKNCPVACRVVAYDLSVDENDMITTLEDSGINESATNDTSNYTEVRIMLSVIRNTVYHHKAQITGVEILGYVGGYLGIWLGISVPLVYDHICNSLQYIIPVLRRRRKQKANELINI